MSVRNACMMLTLIVCLIAVSGCTDSDRNGLPRDKYVAIEERLVTSSNIIEGSYNLPPHITLPFIFNYDGSENGSNWAEGSRWERSAAGDNYYPAVNDSLKVLYGTEFYRDVAPMDTRTGLRIKGIYSYPYECESGFVIQSIDSNGTINGSYNNTSIILKIGEQWTTPVYTEIRAGNGTGMGGKPFSYTASFNTTWTIWNLDIVDKANLARYNNSATDTGMTLVFGGADPMQQ